MELILQKPKIYRVFLYFLCNFSKSNIKRNTGIKMKHIILLLMLILVEYSCISKSKNKDIIIENKINKINQKYRSSDRDSIRYFKYPLGKISYIYMNLSGRFDIPKEIKYLDDISEIHIYDPVANFNLLNMPKTIKYIKIYLPRVYKSININIDFKYLNKITISGGDIDTINIIGKGEISHLTLFGIRTKCLKCNINSLYNLETLHIAQPYPEKVAIKIDKGCFGKLKRHISHGYIYEKWFLDYLEENNVKSRLRDSTKNK